jgi:hypothetical protein
LIAILVVVPTVALPQGRFASAQTIDTNKEYNLKAVFLYSFGRYITWNTRAANSGDFKILVVGDSPISERLEKIAAKRQINGRALKVKVADTSADIAECHILFISKEVSDEDVARLTERLAGDTIVVGERPDLMDRGASAIFFIDGTSVRFELHPNNLQSKDVQVDAKLLSLSRNSR